MQKHFQQRACNALLYTDESVKFYLDLSQKMKIVTALLWTLLGNSNGFSSYKKTPFHRSLHFVHRLPTQGQRFIQTYDTCCTSIRRQRQQHSRSNIKVFSTAPQDTSTTQDRIGGLDLNKIVAQIESFKSLTLPYFIESKSGRWLFIGLIALTLMNSGVSVAFSYVGKDFWNALSSKDPDQFYDMIWKYAAALLVGSPVSVLYKYVTMPLPCRMRVACMFVYKSILFSYCRYKDIKESSWLFLGVNG